MSSIAFDQLKDQVRLLPSEVIQAFRAALQLETEERQKLLEGLSAPPPPQLREVKVRKVVARDFTAEMQWIREHAHLYPSEQLALSGTQLLAHGTDPGQVFDAARATGQRFLMHRVPQPDEVWGREIWV